MRLIPAKHGKRIKVVTFVSLDPVTKLGTKQFCHELSVSRWVRSRVARLIQPRPWNQSLSLAFECTILPLWRSCLSAPGASLGNPHVTHTLRQPRSIAKAMRRLKRAHL